MAAAAVYRPMKQRQLDQMEGARRLSLAHQAHGARRGYVPLAQATQTRTVSPIVPRQPDRGWRVPYFVPRVPGAGDGQGGQGGDGNGSGGCCG